MVAIPANVLDLFKRPDSSKILITACKCGQPHAIVCGSIIAVDDETLAVGEVLMQRSKKYMDENKKVEILVNNGKDSYGVEAEVVGRETSGPLFDNMKANLAKFNLPTHAVWTFKAKAVYCESAGPDAGKKIA